MPRPAFPTAGLAAALALALAGCSNVLGIDDPRLTDAGGPDIDADVTDAPVSLDITGRSYYRTFTSAGMEEVAMDLSSSSVRALVTDGTEPTGYRIVTGTGRADGTFTIEGVPLGERYLLAIGGNYFSTEARTIDRRIDVAGSPDAPRATQVTSVAVNVGNMQAFNAGVGDVLDYLEIEAPDAAYYNSFSTGHGARSWQDAFDWRSGFNTTFAGGPGLPTNETVRISHLRDSRLPAGTGGRTVGATRLIDHAEATGVTLMDGQRGEINATFSPVALDRTLQIQGFQRGGYDSAYDPSAAPFQLTLGVYASPYAGDVGAYASLVGVSLDDWSRSTSLLVNASVAYGDPFPVGWTRVLVEDYRVARYLRLPGTTSPRPNLGGTSRRRALPGGIPSLTPGLQPPSNFKIENLDAVAGGKAPFDGTRPLSVTWSPVAGAKVYQLRVSRVFANGAQTIAQAVAAVMTDETALLVPAEVFSGGEFFIFTLSAIQSPADYAGGALYPNGLPVTTATVPSGLFRLRSSCGNTMVDSGESCDRGGEAMDCDLDCTPVQCGDGLVNRAAGEVCDSVRDSRACDADCSLPVCGDGYVNTALEDCDDGNIIAEGNGCSADCKFNNVCGNGVLERSAEACDSGGNSATCDSDCTLRSCGDGFVNPVAGEECDHGAYNGSGSGCTTACRNG